MKKVLVTGGSGFIGHTICKELSTDFKVIGTYNSRKPSSSESYVSEKINLCDLNHAADIFNKHKSDVVIHSAAVAHQKVSAIDRDTYFQINSHATEAIAKASIQSNPDVLFIFLSSISVYGENNLTLPVSENHRANPTSDYGASKLDAENRLIRLFGKSDLRHLIILRLAPVYDREWHFNLDRRVLFPKNLFYMKFGAGIQEMSALARPNLIDFITYLINTDAIHSKKGEIYNVCDEQAYTFNKIIHIFKQTALYPGRPIMPIPLFPVFLGTRFFGMLFSKQREWFHACYEKLASSLIFDNRKMLETGFKPRHSLDSVFSAEH